MKSFLVFLFSQQFLFFVLLNLLGHLNYITWIMLCVAGLITTISLNLSDAVEG